MILNCRTSSLSDDWRLVRSAVSQLMSRSSATAAASRPTAESCSSTLHLARKTSEGTPNRQSGGASRRLVEDQCQLLVGVLKLDPADDCRAIRRREPR